MKRIGRLWVKGKFFRPWNIGTRNNAFWTLRTAQPEDDDGWKAKEGTLVNLMLLNGEPYYSKENGWPTPVWKNGLEKQSSPFDAKKLSLYI